MPRSTTRWPFRYRPPATNWTVRKPNRTVFFVQHPVGQTAGAGTDELYGKSVQGGVLNAPRMHPVQGAGDGQGKFPTVDGTASGGAADLGLQGAAHRLTHRGSVNAKSPSARASTNTSRR